MKYRVHYFFDNGEVSDVAAKEVAAVSCSDACSKVLVPGTFVIPFAATMVNQVDEEAKAKSEIALEAGYKARFS